MQEPRQPNTLFSLLERLLGECERLARHVPLARRPDLLHRRPHDLPVYAGRGRGGEEKETEIEIEKEKENVQYVRMTIVYTRLSTQYIPNRL